MGGGVKLELKLLAAEVTEPTVGALVHVLSAVTQGKRHGSRP